MDRSRPQDATGQAKALSVAFSERSMVNLRSDLVFLPNGSIRKWWLLDPMGGCKKVARSSNSLWPRPGFCRNFMKGKSAGL
jgi:hypothetical protein